MGYGYCGDRLTSPSLTLTTQSRPPKVRNAETIILKGHVSLLINLEYYGQLWVAAQYDFL